MSELDTPPGANVLKITLDDLATLAPASLSSLQTDTRVDEGAAFGPTIYGTVNDLPDTPALPEQQGSVWLQAWLYLGVAGLLGALAGWGICEPAFADGGTGTQRWGNVWLLPLIVALMCLAFGTAESLVERSTRKGLIRAAISLPSGIVAGFIFNTVANILYNIGLAMLGAAGVQSFHNPAAWIVRGIAWAAFGAAGGLIYGLIGQSGRKAGYGALGGAAGALLGGMVFDPIAFATRGGAPSRAVGFALLGMATGVAMGLVESALKDRWLYVTSGPLAGKQFILYKPVTTLGSNQQADIYLFKDAEILPAHATLQLKGPRLQIVASGPVSVGGTSVRGARVLQTGDALRIGRYGFRYQEKGR